MEKPPVLHLGVTMAGAVSAGAYTAGVIDYLIEAIYRWEEDKKAEAHLDAAKKTVPPHQIRIDVIGGASAGGITAALSALSCYSGLIPVRDAAASAKPDFKPKNNLLFDTWVNLNGSKDTREVIRRMLEVSDLRCADGIPSLLNSAPIDDVAAGAIAHVANAPRANWPSFVAPDLEVLLTLCSLRGIPVGIDFNSDNNSWRTRPSHQMSIHKQFARFTTGQLANPNRAMTVDPGDKKSLEQLIGCAKATAAFPVGLRARDVTLSRNHIRHQYGTFFKLSETTLDNIFKSDTIPDPFPFTSVDGGTLNNEPFGEIATIMNERGIRDFAMILVDPFPNFGENNHHYKLQPYLKDVLFPILGALRNQGMLKENDLREIGRSASGQLHAEYRKNMIFPTRHRFDKKEGQWYTEENPLACGALDGFSGFLSRDFRHHDFFLGRHNCRNFLRSYFTMEYNLKDPASNHAIFSDWTPQMIQRYRVRWRDEGDVVHLPIIPVQDFVIEEERIRTSIAKLGGEEAIEDEMKAYARRLPCPFPVSNRQTVNRLRWQLAWRLLYMAHRLTDNLFSPRPRQRYRWWRKPLGWVLKWAVRTLLLLLLPFLFVYFAGKIISIVRRDLRKNGLLPSRRKKAAKPTP